MLARLSKTQSEGVLPPQVAGVSYPAPEGELSEMLARSIVTARNSSIEAAKLVIAPLSPLSECGPVMASALANLAKRRGIVRRVVVMGPARSALRGFAVPQLAGLSTPIGTVPIDRQAIKGLIGQPLVSADDRSFLGEPAIETVLPLLQVCLEQFTLVPILVGSVSAEDVAAVLTQVWGGPETLIVVMSDLSHNLSDERARVLDVQTRGIIETLSADQLATTRADGHRIIAGALMRAAALDLRVTGVDLRHTTIAPGKVRGHGAFLFESAQNARLSVPERQYLLRAAAISVETSARGAGLTPRPLATGRQPMTLSAMRAVTVTLEKDGVQRGRAGGLRPIRPLLDEVMARAGQAAREDRRFSPVSLPECAGLTIDIAITSTPRPMPASSPAAALGALMPGRDGLIFEDRGRIAIAYPSAWRTIPEAAVFLTALKQQAGFGFDYWSPTISLRRFTVESFSARFEDVMD